MSGILENLRDVAVAARINKPIGDKMILNGAFLVSRDKERAFDSQRQAGGRPARAADIQVHGPLAAL